MAKTIRVDKIGELIDEEPFDMNWFSYDLGGGWGAKISKKGRTGRNFGSVIQGINKDTSVQKVIKYAKNGDFDEIAGFYPAILLFFGEKFIDKVDFSDNSNRNRISRLIDNLKGPKHLKDDILEFVKQDFDFLSFIEACGRNENLNFDVDSAISVYKLQGKQAIYPILCQIFYVNKKCDGTSVCLIQGLPVSYSIEISNFVSGCHFPVAVSPAVTNYKWEETQNGHFLYGHYGEDWCVLDAISVGRVNLSNYALANRLNYLGSGGIAYPYLICWNWKEIINAYHYFGCDLLVRDLKNTIFDHYWFNFGPNSLINVEFCNNVINERSNYEITVDTQYNIPTGKKQYITLQLDGKFVKYCNKEDICYSKSEVYDWFELASLL